MKDFFIYILKCSDGSYYVGHTDDIDKRMSEHEQGFYEGYTSSRRPLSLVYLELIGSRDAAIESERKLKGWSRKKKELLIAKGWKGIKSCWRLLN